MLALAAIALLSCAREQVDVPETITIRAYQEGAAETRTTLIDGGTQVYWEPADELKLFFRGTGSRFLSQNTEVADIAEFSGSLNVVVGVNEGASGSNTLWGLYPYRADATSDGTSVTTTLPTDQTGRADSFAKGTFITLAKSTSFDLAFYNVCGGIRFSLTTEGVKEVVFQGQNDEDIAGKVKLAFVDGVPAVQEVLDGQKSITLTAPGGGTFETGKWYYIVTLPGTLSNGFKMTFNTETQYATLKSSGSKTIKRGIFGSLADADEDLIFKDKEGGDIPNPEDVIQFEDPIAKYACVDKFDTNKDGEISSAEAAAVTSLEGLFTDWNTVTSFDEIRYFTSVTSTEKVFTGLAKLTHITIPDNITKLGTFQNCSALVTVSLPDGLALLPTYCFDGCSSLASVILPTEITSIPDYAFRNCSALTTLVFPSALTSVGQYAFSDCIALSDIDLPIGFKTIGSYAFRNCQALTNIDFPVSLISIGQFAFSGCISLASIVIGDGVSVGSYAFSGCSAMDGANIGTNVSLGTYAFSDCSALTFVIMSNGVSVGQSAYSGCISLTSVVLPEDMTSLPVGCFMNCTSLSTITWPTELATIGNDAFNGCPFNGCGYALQLPSSITAIGSRAFTTLRHLILPSNTPISIASDSFFVNYTVLYVPANMVDMYKVRTNWSNYSNRIRPIEDYPVIITPMAVDLGLSVKWADCNVGAWGLTDFGNYYSWGETQTKPVYTWSTYKWIRDNMSTNLTKYCTNSSYGKVDNKTQLDLEDDAAYANWGGTWRTPTDAEWIELWSNSTCTRETINGVKGWRYTSTKEGFTDKSIFIPAAGQWVDSGCTGAGSNADYWTSSLYVDSSGDPRSAWSAGYGRSTPRRYRGLPIRPVCD